MSSSSSSIIDYPGAQMRASDQADNDFIGSESIRKAFTRNEDLEADPKEELANLERKPSRFSHGFLSKELKFERRKLFFSFIKNWVIMTIGILGVFSIYWGAFYQRSLRYHRIHMLMVVEDEEVDGVQPVIGQAAQMVTTIPSMKLHAHIEIQSASVFEQNYKHKQKNQPFNSTQMINELVHHQKFWTIFHIKPNASYSLFQALRTADSSYDPNANEVSVDIVYETGRDVLAMNQTMLPVNMLFYELFGPELLSEHVIQPLVANLTSEEKTNLINSAPQVLSNLPVPQWKDRLPVYDITIMAPSQVGMIFLIILTFFQFNFFADTHQIIMQRIKKLHFVVYRMIASQILYFVLSLAYAFVSLAFQVDFEKAFGHLGFLVFWMTCFLTMSAVGGANENMALFIIPVFPPLLGFWLSFWVIFNIAPTFFPLVVLPKVFRYGYATPLHNALEAFKVIFTNSYKGQLGRNYGILVAWLVLNNAILPFALKFFGTRMAKKMQKK